MKGRFLHYLLIWLVVGLVLIVLFQIKILPPFPGGPVVPIIIAAAAIFFVRRVRKRNPEFDSGFPRISSTARRWAQRGLWTGICLIIASFATLVITTLFDRASFNPQVVVMIFVPLFLIGGAFVITWLIVWIFASSRT